MKLLILVIMMAIIVMPSVAAEQEMIVSGSLGTEYRVTITDSHYQIGDNGNIEMIVKMSIYPCYPFEAEARMNDDGTISFLADDLVEYHLLEVLYECELKFFFEGDIVNGTTIIFPNPNGKYGENLLGFPQLEEDLTLFLDERLMVVTPENASWKVLVFPDEEKFIVYRR